MPASPGTSPEENASIAVCRAVGRRPPIHPNKKLAVVVATGCQVYNGRQQQALRRDSLGTAIGHDLKSEGRLAGLVALPGASIRDDCGYCRQADFNTGATDGLRNPSDEAVTQCL
jgi:hypothetical protein